MTEPFFAPTSQLWPAMPLPAFGYVPTPMTAINRTVSGIQPGAAAQGASPFGGTLASASSQALPPDVYALAATPFAGGPNAAVWSPILSNPYGVGGAGWTGAETAVGVTPPALLASV